MKNWHSIIRWFLCLQLISFNLAAQSFPLEAVTSYPFHSELTASASGSLIAVAVNEQGRRNIYTASAPAFAMQRITSYTEDDGVELTSLRISADNKWIAYVRGGDHGAYDESVERNPASLPREQKIELWVIAAAGGKPVLIGDGDKPQISPDSKQVAFIRNDEVWSAPLDGSARAKKLFYARGKTRDIGWSHDGKKLLFVSARGDHSFIGLYRDSIHPIQWIAPAVARDESPRWSRDGSRIVFVRREAAGGKPDSLTVMHHESWSICVADESGRQVRTIWTAPRTLRGSVPSTEGGYNLHWAADDQIIYASYEDGWPHLYAIEASGGEPRLLTKGNFALEHVTLSSDGKWIAAAVNNGADSNDLHRRHVVKISVNDGAMQFLTNGNGIETQPQFTGDGHYVAMISATPQWPGVLSLIPSSGGTLLRPGAALIPKNFPFSALCVPKAVKFKSSDGLTVYGQLFSPANNAGKSPAVVFVHGGPERQMLLGWHYGDYYANAYALNQWLVSQGFVVLSVNYRLGIGYGFDFQHAPNTWIYGAAEYLDIKAAGEWLAQHPAVDKEKIGIYGGSYGGFLTAMALARDSRIFRAGVDIHGVHNHTNNYSDEKGEQAPDAALAKELIWRSSPVAWLDTWKSPVLLIHGDDDGNVEFGETVDLARRFQQKGFPFESLVIPDETHHWMKYSNMLKVDSATADFLKKHLTK